MAIFSSTTKKHHAAAKLEGTETPSKVVKAKAKKVPKAKAIEAAITSPVVKKSTKASKAVVDQSVPVINPSSVIIAPHMTEKAGIQHESLNVYTFKVTEEATKGSITKAIKTQYKVTPVKVNITRSPDRPITYRGRPSTTSGFKKALVFLKKGDKIEV